MAECQRMTEDGAFMKILKADYSRQKWQPLVVMSVDAANCYDRVNHVILALMLHAMGIPIGPILAMLLTIQQMKYYLRTGFGESKSYMGGGNTKRPMHGMRQGNRASPACWSLVSAVIAKIELRSEVMGCLFVDDTNLFALDEAIGLDDALWTEAQCALDGWGHKLNATGGALKPSKCYMYWLGYEWKDDGTWVYQTSANGHDALTVPTSAGREPINLCSPHTPKEMLGVVTSPDGNSNGHFTKIVEKLDKWVLRMTVGGLPAQVVWTSYFQQLWPGLQYGIGTLPTTLSEATSLLDTYHRRMLPMLGVNCNIRKGWQTLHPGFLGVGLYDFTVEMVIEKLNLFFQHYGSLTDAGITLWACLENLQVECGYAGNPFNHPYQQVGPYTTHSWVKSLWECIDHYHLRLTLSYPTLTLPRERDKLLTTLFLHDGNWVDQFPSLNRCRIYCLALFLSDVVTVDRRHIHPSALTDPVQRQEFLSKYTFPQTSPTQDDWDVWKEFWTEFTGPRYTLRMHLGPWTHSNHRVYAWQAHPIAAYLRYQEEDAVQ
eukprot:CCRYP_012569-RA/>CCRYP_012569-RA protein AED:0.31 eAED:0.31 QI:0/0/0/1/1/1/2/0/544